MTMKKIKRRSKTHLTADSGSQVAGPLVADGGQEHVSAGVEDIIRRCATPPMQPQFKPAVERLFASINNSLLLTLPGHVRHSHNRDRGTK